MAVLPIQDLPNEGSIATLAFTAADAGLTDTYANDGRVMVIVQNTNAATRTVSRTPVASLSPSIDETGTATTVPVTPGFSMLAPVPKSKFNDGSGNVSVVISVDVGISYAVVRLPFNP